MEAKAAAEGLKLSKLEAKWTKPLIEAGYTVVPNVIFQRQQALGLTPLDINILLQLFAYWWKPGDLARPSKKAIATAIGIHETTVRKRIKKLEGGGLIKRIEQRISKSRNKPNLYDFAGLIKEATPYALEDVEKKAERKAEALKRLSRKGKPALKVVAKK